MLTIYCSFLLRSASTTRSSSWSLENSSCNESGLWDEHSVKVSLYEEFEFMESNDINMTNSINNDDNAQIHDALHV